MWRDLGITETDGKALLSDFRRAMQQDLDRLDGELKLNALKTLLSKEVAVAIAVVFWYRLAVHVAYVANKRGA